MVPAFKSRHHCINIQLSHLRLRRLSEKENGMENILEVIGLGVSFGNNRVLTDVTFEVKSGEVLGIIGPNGAGKTVLLNLISGMLAPSCGKILYQGQDIGRWDIVKRTQAGIGRTFQVPRPFEQMTVYENLIMSGIYGRCLSERRAAVQAEETLRFIGLDGQAMNLAGKLGLLDRKRLEIGAALCSAPKLILLDEVAGGLTEVEVANMLKLVSRIRAKGISVVWIEHVLQTMIQGTDRVLCLSEGKVIISGKPRDVLSSPEVKEVYLGVDEK